jgi:hypothetical protein
MGLVIKESGTCQLSRDTKQRPHSRKKAEYMHIRCLHFQQDMSLARAHTHIYTHRSYSEGKCGNYRDATTIVTSVDACAYAASQGGADGFCIENQFNCHVWPLASANNTNGSSCGGDETDSNATNASCTPPPFDGYKKLGPSTACGDDGRGAVVLRRRVCHVCLNAHCKLSWQRAYASICDYAYIVTRTWRQVLSKQ